jgi:adenine-specific DNA-methyltransferase
MPILRWLTRDEDIKSAGKAAYRLLREVPELGAGDKNTENMIIQGDNLEALKALLPFYAGQVKCIYIDPPYNTESAFEHFDDNLENTIWLSIIYPRLELLRDFLTEDGVIFVNLDERQHAYTKVIMDEVFGRKNFIGDIIWHKRKGGGNDSRFIALDHDYILTYCKNTSKDFHPDKWRISYTGDYLKRYKEIDEENRHYYWDTLARDGLRNPIPISVNCPDGTILSINSQISQQSVEEGLKSGIVRMVKNKTGWTLHHRVYMPEGKVLRSILEDCGTNKDASDEMELLFGDSKAFDYPKPEALIRTLLELNTKEGDLVLDSFLGSGTTAAVAHKMGRRYIGIEMGEQAKTHCAVRLKKVIEGEQGGISKSVDWNGGGGFRFYTLGDTIFDDDGQIRDTINFDQLAAHLWFYETKTPFNKPKAKSTFLGVHDNIAYALLYNGILHDKRIDGGNVLTSKTLTAILKDIGKAAYDKLVVYGEASRFGAARLKELKIEFKQTPYDVRAK